MGYRDEQTATRARVEQLEQELSEAREQLATRAADASLPVRVRPGSRKGVMASVGMALAFFAAAYYAGFQVSGQVGEQLGLVFGMLGLLCLIGAATLKMISQLLVIVSPSEVAVISGRAQQLSDGTTVGYRVMIGGRALRIPLLESVDYMSLRNQQTDVSVQNAYTRDPLPLRVEAVANFKVGRDPLILGHAIERFLGRSEKEQGLVVSETLEGALRGVIATLTVEEVVRDRREFEMKVIREVEGDLSKVGFTLDSFKVLTLEEP